MLERAVGIAESKPTDPLNGAVARFQLARALWRQGTRERAVALAKQARDVLAARQHPDLAEIDRWLATRGSR